MMAGFWIYLIGLLLCIDHTVANHLSRNRTLTRDQLFNRRRTVIPSRPNGNNGAPPRGRGPLAGRAGNPPGGGGVGDPIPGGTGLPQRDIDRVILTPVQDGAVRSLRNMLSTRRGRGNPRLIGFLIPRADGRTQLRLMRGAERFLQNGRGDNRGNRVNVNELPFNIRTIVAAARRANLLPSRNGTRVRNRTPPIVVLRSPNKGTAGFQQSRQIATLGGFGGQNRGPGGGPPQPTQEADTGGETIKQRTVNIEVNVQSPDTPGASASPAVQNPNAGSPGMMNPALMNSPQTRFRNNMGPGARGFNPMFNPRQQPGGFNPRNGGLPGFNRPSPRNNNNRNNNRPADDSSSSSSSNSGGGNINIGLGIGVGSSSPVVPPKPASTKTPASSPQFGGGMGMPNISPNAQPTPPDPFQHQRGGNPFDPSGFSGMPGQTGFPPSDPSGFPANTQISFPSNPQTGFPPSNQFQPNANNPPTPSLQRFDQQPPAISGAMPANSMPWNTFQTNPGNFGQDTGSLANTNPLINSNQNVFANNMQRSNGNGMQFIRNIPQQANGLVQTPFNTIQSPQQFNNLASNQNFANSPVLTSSQSGPGDMGSMSGPGGFDPTQLNAGSAFPQGSSSFGGDPMIGEPMIIDNGGRTTVVVDNITFTGLLPPGPPVLKTQVINGKSSVHINPLVSSQQATNSFGRNFPPQLHFTNPNDINSINQNILRNADSNHLFQNPNILGLPATQGTKSPVEPQMNQDTSFGTPSIFVNTSGLINLTQSVRNTNMAWGTNNITTLGSNSTNQPQMIDISIPLNTNPMSDPSFNLDTLSVNGGSSVNTLATATTDVPALLPMVTADTTGHSGHNLMSGVHGVSGIPRDVAGSSAIPHNLMTSTMPVPNMQSLTSTVPPQILANDPQLQMVENIPPKIPADIPQTVGNGTHSAGSLSQTPTDAFQTQLLAGGNVQNPAMAFNNPQLLEMQRQQQILHMHRLALLKRREEQLNTLRNQLLQMGLQGNQRQPVQRKPPTPDRTKDLRILENIKPGAAKAPQTTASSAVAFMNVDSLRSLIEEVLHGFFKKQKMTPTDLPNPTGISGLTGSIGAISGSLPQQPKTLAKDLNLLQLNMTAVQLSTSPTGSPMKTQITSTVPPVYTVTTGAEPLPTEPTQPTVTDPAAVTDPNPTPITDPSVTMTTVVPIETPVTDLVVAPVTDPNGAVVTDPSAHHVEVPGITVIPVTETPPAGVFSTTVLPHSTSHIPSVPSLSSSSFASSSSASSSTSVIMDSVGNSVGQPSLSGQKRNMFPGGIAVHPELSAFQAAQVRNIQRMSPADLQFGIDLLNRGVPLPGRARGIVSSIPEMVGGGLSSTNARVITHQHRPLDRTNSFNLRFNRHMQDIAMTPNNNNNVPVRQPGGVPVFPTTM